MFMRIERQFGEIWVKSAKNRRLWNRQFSPHCDLNGIETQARSITSVNGVSSNVLCHDPFIHQHLDFEIETMDF